MVRKSLAMGELIMENIIIINLIVLIVVYVVCTVTGLDLNKWYSWLAGFYGFISGCSIGFLMDNPSPSWELGLIFAFIIMSSGAVMRQQRQRYSREAAEEWLAQYGQRKELSLLTRIMKKLIGK